MRAARAGVLLGTALAALPALAQTPTPPLATVADAPTGTIVTTGAPATTIRSIAVAGNERLEPETVLSYTDLRAGETYDRERLDRTLKALFATELFADVQIRDNEGVLTIQVRENPVINRVIVEGAKRIKEDKIREEVRLAPRQIFTRSKARSDVGRILELYRRSGRFAARVEPKIVELDQNRVDLVFEIAEGAKSKVRQINVIGNEEFSDGKIRGAIATKQARPWRLFASSDTYDPDRMAFDQQKMRQFYLTEGYADFRVVSAVAELTPDRRDFIVTYVVEEGERYKFGDIDLESQIRDIRAEQFKKLIGIKKDDWYDAQIVESTIERLTETSGLLGYAFADVRPRFDRDRDAKQMNVTFLIGETPRVYVERIDINGNVRTRDAVVRREFRLVEGDAFNSFKLKRSRDRIQSLGFFQEKLEVTQKPGSGPDKVLLETNLEERPTGEFQVSAGFSSLERFILSFSVRERNFLGKGQELRLGINLSSYSRSIEAGFTEPYLFGRNLALGFDVFRRDLSSFRFGQDNRRDTTYEQVTTGAQIRTGFPVTEFLSASLRYGLNKDDISLDRSTYFRDFDGSNTLDEDECDPNRAGRYLCEALGNRLTSSAGYTVAFDNLDNRQRPTRGNRLVFSQDVAGLGGDVNYVKSTVRADKYWNLGSGFILNVGGEAGNIFGWGGDTIRLTDRFFLGEPRFRGFEIRGVGPRVIRRQRSGAVSDSPATPSPLPTTVEGISLPANTILDRGPLIEDTSNDIDDAIGGRNYYLGRVELNIPLGSAGAELGLRPSVFMDVGALWSVTDPGAQNVPNILRQVLDQSGAAVLDSAGRPTFNLVQQGYEEFFLGNSPAPRVTVGFGVSWNSPFGPFRFDISRALKKEPGDNDQVFQFNVGTAF